MQQGDKMALPNLGKLAIGVQPQQPGAPPESGFNLLYELASDDAAAAAFLDSLVPLSMPIPTRRILTCDRLLPFFNVYGQRPPFNLTDNPPPPGWADALAKAALLHCGWPAAVGLRGNVRQFLDRCAGLPSNTSPAKSTNTTAPPKGPKGDREGRRSSHNGAHRNLLDALNHL
jgi:hypothetical protein